MSKNKIIVLLLLALSFSIYTNITLLKRQAQVENNIAEQAVDGVSMQTASTHNNSNNGSLSGSDGLSSSISTQDKVDQLYSDDNRLNLLIAKAHQYFDSYQFAQAVDLYEEIYFSDEDISFKLKLTWLQQANLWLKGNQINISEDFVEQMLRVFPYDYETSILQLAILKKRGDNELVFERYLDLIRNQFDSRKHSFLESQLQAYYQQWSAHIMQLQNWSLLIEQTEKLIDQQGFQVEYILVISEAHIHLNNIDNALAYLEQVEGLPQVEVQLNKLLRMIERKERNLNGIPLIKDGDHMLVNARFNQGRYGRLMIDTGASLTVISERLLNELSAQENYDVHRTMTIRTASGEEQAYSIIIKQFTIDAWTVENLEVVIMPLESMDSADGLLGMNFLKQFTFNIDQQERLLFLQEK
ncbi:retropepsin-like aspartic protease [Thalassotalea sp. Y01]|uniref:retropepsin-like aspartic protease n=1 Tax=Thalassotalea sp. Y01 TaxID=2729613 RepID=UPI00145E8373|nr:retropepsin-like aspartic protease [Thalassotalea sp. Y01]NMP15615.1 clan AA aspartic protease [Thalassotalea sp. Y01]